jgi:predicted  nucleic acid-binding Zn-ribbon protein
MDDHRQPTEQETGEVQPQLPPETWDFMPPAWRPAPTRRSASASAVLRRRGARATSPPKHDTAATVYPPPASGGNSGYEASAAGAAAAKPRPSADPPSSTQSGPIHVAKVPPWHHADLDTPTKASCLRCDELRARIAVLELELTEKTWAVSRAVELSDAVARLEEDNTRLTRELAAANVTLLGQKRRIDELENTVIDAIAFQERVATAGRACLRCLETEETKRRRDVAEGERAQRYALECEWNTYTNTWKFASVQCIETEIELMWREDQLAHAAALRDAQRRVDEVDVVAAELSTALRDVETWKVKYRDLKEKGRAHIEDLRAVHEENLKRARATYLRCNPNQATLFWALEHLAHQLRAIQTGARAFEDAKGIAFHEPRAASDAGLRVYQARGVVEGRTVRVTCVYARPLASDAGCASTVTDAAVSSQATGSPLRCSPHRSVPAQLTAPFRVLR